MKEGHPTTDTTAGTEQFLQRYLIPACPETSICVQIDNLAVLPATKSLKIHLFGRKQSIQIGRAGIGFSRLRDRIVQAYQKYKSLSGLTKDAPLFRLPSK